jgi:hypothetical protein
MRSTCGPGGLKNLLRSPTQPRLAHNVRSHGSGQKCFQHPVVGEVTLVYEEPAVTAEPGHALLIYSAEPGSPSAERPHLLASRAADSASSNQPVS